MVNQSGVPALYNVLVGSLFGSWYYIIYVSQVGTKDGWVKVIGADGVEAFMCGSCEAGTVYLGFLKHRSVLLRVTKVSAYV